MAKAYGGITITDTGGIVGQALESRLKYIWVKMEGADAGTYAASGRENETPPVPFDLNTPTTYGFNSLLRHTYLSFRYNTYQLVTIGTGADSTASGIVINTPVVNNQNVITGVKRGMELTNTSVDIYGDTDRVAHFGDTVQIGKSSTGHTNITAAGMEIYRGDTTNPELVAEFKSYMNIGTNNTNTYTGSAAMGVGLTTTKTNQIVVGRYNGNNSNATFIIGDGLSSSNKSNLLTVGNIVGKQITDTFVGNGNTNAFTLSSIPTSMPTVIPDESSTTTYTISSWSDTDKDITLNTNVVENEQIQFQYTTNEKGGYLVVGNISGIHGKGAIVGGESINNSTMTASGTGASIHGTVYASTMTASGYGASIHGYAWNSTMTASGFGVSIHGHADTNGTMVASGTSASIYGDVNNSTMTASGTGASIYGYAGKNSTMTASSVGASIHGYIYDNSTMTASDICASIYGYAFQSTITALSTGASIYGSASTNSKLIVSGGGASIHGYATDDSTMIAGGTGSSIYGSANNSTITAAGTCTLIHGYAANNSTMRASGSGASIHGYANNSTMRASGYGASIRGYTYDNSTMTAPGYGASICGYATTNSTMTASGDGASVYGYANNSTMRASDYGSIALNEATHALARAQLAIGTYNKDDSTIRTTHPSETKAYGTHAFIIGNGTSEDVRSNALTVDWDGNLNIGSQLNFNSANSTSLQGIYISAYSNTNNMYFRTDGYHGFYTASATDATPSGTFYIQESGTNLMKGDYRRNGNAYIITETKTYTNYTINAGATTQFTESITKTGYTPIGIAGFDIDGYGTDSNMNTVWFSACRISGSNVIMQMHNNGTAASHINIMVTILYKAN